MEKAYRLFRKGPGMPMTLYHTYFGTSYVPLNEWLIAEKKLGSNPGKKNAGTRRFRTGWHVFLSLEALLKYCSRMKGDYVVCEVWIRGKKRRKPGSRSDVWLSEEMFVARHQWEKAFTLEEEIEIAKTNTSLSPDNAARYALLGFSTETA